MQNKNKRAFAPELVSRLMDAERFAVSLPPKEVFLAIDPNGGGESDFALVSCYFDRGTMVICGFESIDSKGPDDHNPILKLHVLNLQGRFPNATIVFIIENNLGFEAKHIQHFCKTHLTGKILHMSEKDCAGSVGFHTDHKLKQLMFAKFNEWLSRDAIRFDEKLLSLNTQKGTQKVLEELTEQLHSYSVITELPKTQFGKIRKTYSGKVSAGAKGSLSASLVFCYPSTRVCLCLYR